MNDKGTGGKILSYKVHFYCWSHTGKHRSMNQDNYICDGRFMNTNDELYVFPISGYLNYTPSSMLGVFDGMGGEERGEMASLIAAQIASKSVLGDNMIEDLRGYCRNANEQICEYAARNKINSMGTTAALLAFNDKEIALCNIGDSKIFRYADKNLEQISEDHYTVAVHGRKPALSQNLGIPESEMIIDPYFARGRYNDGDIYLICTDGLTDMVAIDDIRQILLEKEYDEVIGELICAALNNGGMDNITIILCRIEKEKERLIKRILHMISNCSIL